MVFFGQSVLSRSLNTYIHRMGANRLSAVIWIIVFPARDLHKGQLGLIPSNLMMQPKQNVWRHGSSTEASTLLSRQMEQASPRVAFAASSASQINAMLTVMVTNSE